MTWYAPEFYVPPTPPPPPPAIYQTYVPPAPARPSPLLVASAPPAVVPQAQPLVAAPPAPRPALAEAVVPAGADPALRRIVFLSRDTDVTVQAVVEVIAAQMGYHFVNQVHQVHVPADAGLTWMSDDPNGASAYQDLTRLGAAVAPYKILVVFNPNDKTITLESTK